ncbi:MAG: RNA polymerase sigma factor [Bacteroidales bacterium]|nr:RNA polymerase sigma factor [Bacteroidales bacterium]MCL2132773.1 RNA polymerase sigma factor [Bacteroidales bacterium]
MTDRELVQLFQEGDNPNYAFNLIVRKYRERLYWHIRKLVIDHDDTDDVLQNTLVKTWTALADFRGDSQLFTWLYRIATNEALTFLKAKRTRFFLPLVDVENQLKNKLEDDPYFDGNELQRQLQKAILTLPEKQRVVFNMRYFDDLKYEEMSEILGTSVGALKASYHHAVKKVEELMNVD